MNTTIKQIIKLLERARRTYEILYENASSQNENVYRAWLKEVGTVLQELPKAALSVKGAENLQKVPEGYELKKRTGNPCSPDNRCDLEFLKENGGCPCLKPIAAPLVPEPPKDRTCDPFGKTNPPSKEVVNNGSKFDHSQDAVRYTAHSNKDSMPKCTYSSDGAHKWYRLGGTTYCVNKRHDGRSECGFNLTKWELNRMAEPDSKCTIKGTDKSPQYRIYEMPSPDRLASKKEMEAVAERVKGVEKYIQGIESRIKSAGGYFPMTFDEWKEWSTHWVKEVESLAARIAGVDSTVAKFIGSTNRILNGLRKDVNELLAEKTSNVQRIEKLEEAIEFESSQKKVNLEEIIAKLRTL